MRVKPTLEGQNLEVARRLIFDVTCLLEKHDITYFLEGGTLLGIVRNGDLLPWDHDVDISVNSCDVEKILRLKIPLLRLGYKLTVRKSPINFGPVKKGAYSVIKIKPIFRYMAYMLFPKTSCRMVIMDVFVKYSDKQHTYWVAEGNVMRVEREHYDKYECVAFQGKSLKVPADYCGYLTKKYGNWKVEVKSWKCSRDEQTVVG